MQRREYEQRCYVVQPDQILIAHVAGKHDVGACQMVPASQRTQALPVVVADLADDRQLIAFAECAGQQRKRLDQSFDILAIVDAAGVHQKRLGQPVTVFETRGIFRRERERAINRIHRRRNIDHMVLGQGQCVYRFLARMSRDGQQKLCLFQGLQFVVIPAARQWIGKIGFFMQQRDQIIQRDRTAKPVAERRGRGDRVITQAFEQTRHMHDVGREGFQKRLTHALGGQPLPCIFLVISDAMSGKMERHDIFRRYQAVQRVAYRFDRVGKGGIQDDTQIVPLRLSGHCLDQRHRVTADTAVAATGGLTCLQINCNSHIVPTENSMNGSR